MSQNTLKVHDLNEDAEFDENGVEVFDEKTLVEEEPGDNEDHAVKQENLRMLSFKAQILLHHWGVVGEILVNRLCHIDVTRC